MLGDRKRKPRLGRRILFSGVLTGDLLEVRRGAHVRTIDNHGDVLSVVWDGKIANWGTLNVGAHLVAIGDQTGVGVLEVVGVIPDWKHVRVVVVRGELRDGQCHLLKFAPRKGAAKRAAKPAAKRKPPAVAAESTT